MGSAIACDQIHANLYVSDIGRFAGVASHTGSANTIISAQDDSAETTMEAHVGLKEQQASVPQMSSGHAQVIQAHQKQVICIAVCAQPAVTFVCASRVSCYLCLAAAQLVCVAIRNSIAEATTRLTLPHLILI